jgi:hypothetical protein
LDGPRFPRRGSRPTESSDVVQKTVKTFPRRGSRPTESSDVVQKNVKTFSGRMVKCWIPKI